MKLRILNGFHQGAEVRLHHGTYTIGSSDDCDFVLKDPLIAPEHMLLVCRNNGYTAERKGGHFLVNGKKCENEKIDLHSKSVVTIGSVRFGIAGDDQSLKSIDLPHQTKKQPSIKPAQTLTNANNKMNSMDCDNPKMQRFGIRFRRFAFVAAMVTMAFICAYWMKAPRAEALIQTKTESEQIAGLFRELNLAQPQIVCDRGEAPSVVGYTQTREEKERIEKSLQTLPFDVKYNIYSNESIQAFCRQVILNMEWLLTVESCDQGKIVLRGFLKELQSAEALGLHLKQDVGGIRSLDQKLWRLNEVMACTTEVLDNYNLSSIIDLSPSGGDLLATGSLNEQERQSWQSAKKEILRRLGKDLGVKEAIQIAKKTEYVPGKIDLPVTGISLGKQPYITMKGSKKYFLGGSVNGHIIKSINANRIVIQIKGREYYYEVINGAFTPANHSAEPKGPAVTASRSNLGVRGDFTNFINEAAGQYGISPELIRAVIKAESDFNPRAVSPKGAMGLMQIMPQNVNEFKINNPFDPRENIMAGACYLKELLARFDQQLHLALAAYNSGPQNVIKYNGIPKFEETQNYVKKVMQYYTNYSNAPLAMKTAP